MVVINNWLIICRNRLFSVRGKRFKSKLTTATHVLHWRRWRHLYVTFTRCKANRLQVFSRVEIITWTNKLDDNDHCWLSAGERPLASHRCTTISALYRRQILTAHTQQSKLGSFWRTEMDKKPSSRSAIPLMEPQRHPQSFIVKSWSLFGESTRD